MNRPIAPTWILVAACGLVSGPPPSFSEPDCVAVPARVIELELEGCRSAAEGVEEQLASPDPWWMTPYLESVVARTPGVLLSGTVRRYRPLAPGGKLGEWISEVADDDLFFPSPDPDFCHAFAGVETALLVQEHPCCDTIPPSSVTCLLGLEEVQSPHPSLRRQMESLEREEKRAAAR